MNLVRKREFTPSDYQAIVDIHNTIYPNPAMTVEAYVEGDQQRNPQCKNQRWVALQDGHIVGFGLAVLN